MHIERLPPLPALLGSNVTNVAACSVSTRQEGARAKELERMRVQGASILTSEGIYLQSTVSREFCVLFPLSRPSVTSQTQKGKETSVHLEDKNHMQKETRCCFNKPALLEEFSAVGVRLVEIERRRPLTRKQ